ncbi:ankyrin [Microthyrium microscopicum]|uniref:Ankyrin n=1 Tax=Microthyrium microscopicum TaxID=703497 RepID=A0A6A6ULU8_9PEZI|nr:ankyrin [Microthyrium microscopicum]
MFAATTQRRVYSLPYLVRTGCAARQMRDLDPSALVPWCNMQVGAFQESSFAGPLPSLRLKVGTIELLGNHILILRYFDSLVILEINMSTISSSSSDNDAVVIDRDDVGNYNPEQILPQSSEDLQSIRNWLQPTSYGLDNGEYRKHLATHFAGTGDWITNSNQYQTWRDGQEQGMLWIKGVPGSGKSVIASKLIAEISRAQKGIPVLYFFFRQIIDANHKPASLLRDWMDQILDYSPPLQLRLIKYVETKRSIDSMSMDDLWRDLRMAFLGLPDKVFCVADALDEMDQGNDEFLRALSELGHWKPHKVKVLITSRPVPKVEVPLKATKCLHIRLTERLVDVDIGNYVQHHLEFSSIAIDDRKLIKEAIPGRANGLFLYAKLAMEAFLEPGADTKEVLATLPIDLNAVYENLLREHARRSGLPQKTQLLILQWVTHATRPLRLIEIAEMLNSIYFSAAERDLNAAKNLVRVACGPLLEILPDETICVVHHSFTEYLNGSTRTSINTGYPVLYAGPTHANLATTCLKYIAAVKCPSVQSEDEADCQFDTDSEYDFSSVFALSKQSKIRMRLRYPFLAYAATTWNVHIAKSEVAGHDQSKLNTSVATFLRDKALVSFWLSWTWPARRKVLGHVTDLQIAASTGLISYTKRLLSLDSLIVDACDNAEGKTPLWWAASNGHAQIVRLLITAGAKPNHEDKMQGLTPMHKAASDNHFAVAAVLLEAGVVFLPHIRTVSVAYRALMWAVERGQTKIVSRILHYPGLDLNTKVRDTTPLLSACAAGRVDIMKLFLANGADPTIICEVEQDNEFHGFQGYDRHVPFSNGRGFTALAAFCRLPPLRKENQVGGSGRRRPPAIDSTDFQDIFASLLEAGANISQRNKLGETPLHIAVQNPLAVELLLRAGADADCEDDEGSTPIFKASPDCLAVLIENGKANIDKRRKDGNTPLLAMLENPHDDPILKLMEYGPDYSLTNNLGSSPLHICLARWNCSVAIMKTFLENGADPNSRNHKGEAPLHVMNLRTTDLADKMEVLLEYGADINAKDGTGATLLFRAMSPKSSGDTSDILKFLIDKGASTGTRDLDGRTLCHQAIGSYDRFSSHVTLTSGPLSLNFCLSQGLDIHEVDHKGNNLLHELASRVDADLVLWKRLLFLGIDPMQKNNNGRVPLHTLSAINWDRSRKSRQVYEIDVILGATTCLDVQDGDGVTPLHLAVTVSETTTKLLLDLGADPTIATFEGMTPLMLAARSRQSNIIGLLLESLRMRNVSSQHTPSSKFKTSKYLSPDLWADTEWNTLVDTLNDRDYDKYTALDYACRSGISESVYLLLQAGAKLNGASTLRACLDFEVEHRLWSQQRHPADIKAYRDASVKLKDSSRPRLNASAALSFGSGSTRVNTRFFTPRMEEIIEMLLKRRPDILKIKSDASMPGLSDRYISTFAEFSMGNDYTATLLLNMNNHQLAVSGNLGGSISNELLESLMLFKQVSPKALVSFDHIKRGQANSDLFSLLLVRREFDTVESLFHLGVDFLARESCGSGRSFGEANLEVLVKFGFASLFEKLGTLEAEAKLKDGLWHAAGNEKKAGLNFHKEAITPDGPEQRFWPWTPFLIQAVGRSEPNMAIVRLLVEKFHVDIDDPGMTKTRINKQWRWFTGNNALMIVAQGSHWWQVSLALPYLIAHGANLEARNSHGQTPLLRALGAADCSVGPYQREAARSLILAGSNVNAVDNDGNTCLGSAGDDIEIIRLLISKGASVTTDALYGAIKSANVAALETLLSSGIDPNIREKKDYQISEMENLSESLNKVYGSYPLVCAAKAHVLSPASMLEDQVAAKEASVEMVELLLRHGADPFAKWEEITFEQQSSEPLIPRHLHMVENLKSQQMERLKSKEDTEKYLSESGLRMVSESRCVLHELLMGSDVVGPILDFPDLDTEIRDGKGRTLLHAACSSPDGPDAYIKHIGKASRPSIFNQLLALGANPTARDYDGRNALHHMLQYRTNSGKKPDIGNSMAQLIKSHPEVIHHRDFEGKTPFFYALDRATGLQFYGYQFYNELNIVALQSLLSAGADPRVPSNKGTTALHLAARLPSYPPVVEVFYDLLSRGLDINARDSSGQTPIFKIFWSGRSYQDSVMQRDFREFSEVDVLTRLQDAGANLAATDNDGRSLLHITARSKDRVGWFEALLSKGLDSTLEDVRRQTPLDIAAACGNTDVLKMFERKEE